MAHALEEVLGAAKIFMIKPGTEASVIPWAVVVEEEESVVEWHRMDIRLLAVAVAPRGI